MLTFSSKHVLNRFISDPPSHCNICPVTTPNIFLTLPWLRLKSELTHFLYILDRMVRTSFPNLKV